MCFTTAVNSEYEVHVVIIITSIDDIKDVHILNREVKTSGCSSVISHSIKTSDVVTWTLKYFQKE